jgi:cystathionine gamma-synthase
MAGPSRDPGLETLAVHAGRAPDPATGAVAPPLVASTTFLRAPDGGEAAGFGYARSDNPNRRALETCLTALEGGREAATFASGAAAAYAVFQSLAPGDHVVCCADAYHGIRAELVGPLARWGLATTFVDTSDRDATAAAFTPRTRLLWLETPTNPLLRIADLEALAALGRARGALVLCDNTFATPVLQRPLAAGCHLVLHSTTKYLGGHSDVMGGAIVAADDAGEVSARVREQQQVAGAVPSPHDCWLLLRGATTLPLRIRAQSASAALLAERLARHPAVHAVHYPGLAAHPGHAVAARQMRAFGAMLSFQVRGGEAAALAAVARVALFTRATSLGCVESLIEHRASSEGPRSTAPRDLIRLSVGLETPADLIADLEQALAVTP